MKRNRYRRWLLVLVLVFFMTGCKKSDLSDTQYQTQTVPEVNETSEKQSQKTTIHTELSEKVLQEQLSQMILTLEENQEEIYQISEMSMDEVDKLLRGMKQQVEHGDDLLHQYYVAELKYEYEPLEEAGNPLIVLQTQVRYYDDVVMPNLIRHVTTYEQAYEAMEEEFQTGFETVVLKIPADLEPDYISWMPEELLWNDALDLPFGFKKVLHMDFADGQSNHLIVLRLEYDCYGITEADQIKASEEVEKLVQDMAVEVREKTADVEKSQERKEQCRILYDLVQEKVEFDYTLNDLLLDLEGNNDSYVATGRSIYGALLYGKSVCSGYATLFHEVCKQLEIPSWVLSGYAENGDHAWNMVILDDGKVYYLDPTWGDSAKWHDTYLFMSEEVMRSENRRVYDFLYIPSAFYEAGYVEYSAPPCLYD